MRRRPPRSTRTDTLFPYTTLFRSRESLSRGTLDGLIFPNESVMSYDLQSFIKFGTKGGNFGSFVAAYVVSDAVWKKLPRDVQKIMTDAGEAATMNICKVIDANIGHMQGKLRSEERRVGEEGGSTGSTRGAQ